MPIVAIVSIAVFPPWDAIRAWLAPSPDTVQEQVDDAIDRGLDGIIVYVDRAGQPPALYAAGWKDRATQLPADPRALFKIASISKMYIATATAKLAVSGSLSLDDTRADHMPELVGSILDQVLGRSHHQYIAKQILSPLELDDTYSLLSQVGSVDRVSGGYHHEVEPDLRQLDHLAPGGSMIATAQDVGVFPRALDDGSLLTDDEQAVDSPIYEYGHTGWFPEYQSIARYHDDLDAVVVQLVNTTGRESEAVSHVV